MAAKACRGALAALGLGLICGGIGAEPSWAQEAPKEPAKTASRCDVPEDSLAAPAPLPHVVTALRQTKKLHILAIGSPVGVGRGARKSYPVVLEGLLEKALAGVDVEIVNRPMSGETVSTAAERIRTEVALARPDLLVWQVGGNDALQHIAPRQFEEDLLEGVRWAKANGVDVLLVGFEANPWLHDEQEANAMRDATKRVALAENALYLRRFEAMQIVARARKNAEQGDDPFPGDLGADCLAEQVSQALAANLVLRRVRPEPIEP
jgi:lysophospholipase L1-like esterase